MLRLVPAQRPASRVWTYLRGARDLYYAIVLSLTLACLVTVTLLLALATIGL